MAEGLETGGTMELERILPLHRLIGIGMISFALSWLIFLAGYCADRGAASLSGRVFALFAFALACLLVGAVLCVGAKYSPAFGQVLVAAIGTLFCTPFIAFIAAKKDPIYRSAGVGVLQLVAVSTIVLIFMLQLCKRDLARRSEASEGPPEEELSQL
jgi:hypothetical protein